MSYVTITQIYKQGGFTNTAGTVNFLRAIDSLKVRVDWTDQQIGGLTIANIEMVDSFEDTVDFQAGNWVYYACLGGTLSSTANAGASSLNVTGLGDSTYTATQKDILAGDYILITNGTNTDLMLVSSVSGSGPWTINLAAAPGQNTATLLNSYGTGSTVARLQFSGYLLSRYSRTTDLAGRYVIQVQGFATRYNNVLCNADIVSQDCATSIYNLCSSYAPTLPEMIVSSGNFASANSYLCTTKAQNGPVLKVLTDIIKTENSQDANVNYALWVDPVRQVHHKTIPGANTATPSGNLGDPGTSHASPTVTIDIANPVANSTYYDAIGPLDAMDMDMSAMVNTAMVFGGQSSSTKQPISIIVDDLTSINAWGYWEGSFTNPDITDEAALAKWGAGQLCITAYPRTTARTTLVSASARITCRDLLQVQGFNDSSVMQFNPTRIKYVADDRQRIITGDMDLAQARPDIGAIINAGANQVSIRNLNTKPPTNLDALYVVAGFGLSTSGLNYTIAAGVVSYNGTLYAVPAYSGTMGSNDLQMSGAQVAGTPIGGVTLPHVVLMPTRVALSRLYANNYYSVTRPASAGSPISITANTNFIGIPLWRISSANGAITGTLDLRTQGGVGNNNLKPPTSGTPTATLNTSTVAAEGAASAYFSFTATVSGMTFDDSIRSIDVSYSIAGANAWHPWVPCSYAPATGSVSGVVHGLAAGQGYDIALQPRGVNGAALGSPLILGSSPTISASAITAAIASWNEFGGTLNTDGSVTGIDGHASSTTHTFAAGQAFSVSADIQLGATGVSGGVILGNTTNGYALYWDAANHVLIGKYVGGVYTVIETQTITQDTNYHTYRLTVLVNSTNTIEASFDGIYLTAVSDSSLTLTSGSWPVTVFTGGNSGRMKQYTAVATTHHYSIILPPPVRGRIGISGGLDVSSTPGTVTGNLPYPNHGTAVTGTLSSTNDLFGSYVKNGTIHRGILDLSGYQTSHNYVYNPTFYSGSTGWTKTGSNFSWGNDLFGGGRLSVNSGGVGFNRNTQEFWEQALPASAMIGSQQLVVSAIIHPTSLGVAGDQLWIQLYDTTAGQLGSVILTNGSSATPQMVSFKATLPASPATVKIRCVAQTANSASCSVQGYFSKLQVEYGNQPSPFVDHLAAGILGVNFDSGANAKSSKMFDSLIPNSLANLSSDIAMAYTAAATSISIWMTSYSGNSNNPNGGQYPCWTNPSDPTTTASIYPTAANSGSSGAPLATFTGLTNGTTYYFVVYYNVSAGTFSITKYNTTPTQAQVNAAIGDGSLLAVVASSNSNGGGIAAGSGSGSVGGGGGHHLY